MTTLAIINSKEIRKFASVAEMVNSLGAGRDEIDLIKSTRNAFFVYVRGRLVGEAFKQTGVRL